MRANPAVAAKDLDSGITEQPLRAHDEHSHDDQEAQHFDRGRREVERSDAFEETDEKSAINGAKEAAHAPQNDDDECLYDRQGAHGRAYEVDGSKQRPGNRGNRAADAEAGQAMGISHYLVEAGKGRDKALELADKVCGNAPMTNFAVMHALPRIAESDPAAGYLTESLMAAIAQGDEEAKRRIRDFLAKRAPKVKGPE